MSWGTILGLVGGYGAGTGYGPGGPGAGIRRDPLEPNFGPVLTKNWGEFIAKSPKLPYSMAEKGHI